MQGITEKSVLLTGGTGFIGQPLCHTLLDQGYEVTVYSRQTPTDIRALCGRVTPVNDLSTLRNHEGFSAVINLAGEGIAERRWSEARKQALRDSRVGLTRDLVDIIRSFQQQPSVMVSGSAVGFYGAQGSNEVSEQTPPRDEFTHRMCRDWEAEAGRLAEQGVRVCLSRTGVVVGPGGGFLKRMAPPFRFGLGGRIGDGTQYMPWVHRDDVVAALIWMMENSEAEGAYNVVSPSPVTNAEFTRTMGATLGRPTPFPVPAWVLKPALGEMSRLLLTGQKARPIRLQQAGFRFIYPQLPEALRNALR